MDESREERRKCEDDVTASEVAAYTYCAKAWHLERVRQVSPDARGQYRRAQGTARHVEHGTRLNWLSKYGRWAVRASVASLFLAIGLVVLVALL
jgi:hypothetical protein